MQKTYIIRIDLESQKGIRQGLPNLLKVFKETKVKASFYLTVGGESNIIEIVKHNSKIKTAAERTIPIFTLKEKMRMAVYPINFAKINKEILNKTLQEGHEIGLHGYKHREWTRALHKIDIPKTIEKMIEEYQKLFHKEPISFAAPGFNTNDKVIQELSKKGITHISDYDKYEKIHNIINIPITIKGKHNTPFIEYWTSQGLTDDQILEKFKEETKGKSQVSFYLHGLYEGIHKTQLIKKMIKYLQEQGYLNKRIIDFK
jgi:undecaprenyl phosphate-alpha-L-ara4FN deformylase